MNDRKYNRLLWMVIILAVLVLSMLGTLLKHNYDSRKAAQTVAAPGNGMGTPRYSGAFLMDNLGLSDEQMDRFREINPEFRSQAQAITAKLSEVRNEMMVEMSQPAPDTIKLNAFADSIGRLHSNMKKLTYNYYLDLREICTPEQETELNRLFNEVFINDITMGGPGRQGRGPRSNRFNNQ